MNKSESKYFNTAVRMDEAFLGILEKKDFAYITVKEICEAAGVNRSTFYLHYETMADLLAESVNRMNEQFVAHMSIDSGRFIEKLRDCPLDELYLVTSDYLRPYLGYIKAHRRTLRTVLENAATLRLGESYAGLTRYVLMPILDRYGVPEKDRKYILAFYIRGLMAIVTEWLKGDCEEPIEYIADLMRLCVRQYDKET